MVAGQPGDSMKSIAFSNPVIKNNKLIKRVANKFFGKQRETKYYKEFFSNITDTKPNGKKILMYVGIGHMYLSPLEILIYHYYRQLGFEVHYVIYDETCKANEVISLKGIGKKSKEVFWNQSVSNARRVLKAAQINFIPIRISSDAYKLADRTERDINQLFNYEFEGIHLGEFVRNTVYRYYRSTDEKIIEFDVAKNFLITTLSNYLFIKELCSKNHYEAVFFSHGIYCTWGPVAEFCKHSGLRFICYDRAKVKDTVNFNIDMPSSVWKFDSAWHRYKNRTLQEHEKLSVKNYLKERELQTNDVFAYNKGERNTSLQEVKRKLSIPENAQVITIYTNLIWDAANLKGEIAFSSPLDCILKTISFFKEKKHIHIVIRPHPAEEVIGTNQTFVSLILEVLKTLPKNVSIADASLEINSFDMIEISDVNVVHTSTIGLEAALFGKPVVLISDTHYRDKGFTLDAESEEHYFQLIEASLKIKTISKEQMALAEKYFYMMMFLYQKKTCTQHSAGIFQKYMYKNFDEFYKTKQNKLQDVLQSAFEKDRLDFIFWDE